MKRAVRVLSMGMGMAIVLAFAGTAVIAHADGSTPPPAAPAAPVTLEALLERFAKSPGVTASFTEEKQIALLAAPLKAEGVIHYSPKRGLVRHATKPAKESVLVNDKELVYWNGKTVQRMNLGSTPVVGTLARAFAQLLAADRVGLEKEFVLTFRSLDNGGYRVVLEPKGADLKKIILAIELEGQGIELSLLRVREKNGDVSTTRFTNVDVAKRYTDAELDRVFKVPPE